MANQLFKLFCGLCNIYILLYRKKGSGSLLRIYLDKILDPNKFSEIKGTESKTKRSSLVCPECGHLIGLSIMHGTKNHPAFRLIKGAFRRKKK